MDEASANFSFVSRLIPIAQVAFRLLLVLVVLNGVMLCADAIFPNWLPASMEGKGFSDDIAQRVGAAEKVYPADAKSGKYLTVLLGLSSLREASDMKAIDSRAGGMTRVIGLCGAGPSLENIAEQARSLVNSNLRPDLVIIGFNDFHQAKITAEIAQAFGRREGMLAAIKRLDLRNFAKKVMRDIWFAARRRDVSVAAENMLFGVRDHIVHAVGGKIDNPMTDPWREMLHLEVPKKASAGALREEIISYGTRRLFDEGTYRLPEATRQIGLVTQLIATLESRGSIVVMVIMPVHSELRAKLPPIAIDNLRKGLAADFANNGLTEPAMFDLRDALPDDDFSDISHVNVDGRSAFSKILADKILHCLPTGRPPLMSDGNVPPQVINHLEADPDLSPRKLAHVRPVLQNTL